ncbi:hypothetical protein VIGAN_04161400, partial [Vigna angularis var. angularis]
KCTTSRLLMDYAISDYFILLIFGCLNVESEVEFFFLGIIFHPLSYLFPKFTFESILKGSRMISYTRQSLYALGEEIWEKSIFGREGYLLPLCKW